MLYTPLPELEGHVRRQVRINVTCMAVLLALPPLLPLITIWSYQLFIGGDGEAFIRALYAPYWLFATLLVTMTLLQGFLFEPKLVQIPLSGIGEMKLRALIARIAKEAGLRQKPRLQIIDSPLFVGVGQTIRGTWCVFMSRDVPYILSEREMAIVIAHELAHVKHANLFSTIIRKICWHVMHMQFLWTMALFFIYALTDKAALDITALSWSIGVIAVFQLANGLLHLAASRSEEYLADAGALAFLGWDYREDLVRSLEKLHDVGRIKSKSGAIGEDRLPEWVMTHPTLRRRAQALGILVDKRHP